MKDTVKNFIQYLEKAEQDSAEWTAADFEIIAHKALRRLFNLSLNETHPLPDEETDNDDFKALTPSMQIVFNDCLTAFGDMLHDALWDAYDEGYADAIEADLEGEPVELEIED